MIFDLVQSDLFNLYTNRSLLQISGSATHNYENQIFVLQGSGKNAVGTHSFYINLITEPGMEYNMDLQIQLKDMRPSGKSQKEFVRATIIAESRKPIQRLLDKDVNFQTSKDRKEVFESLAINFTALTNRTLVGMIIYSQDNFELRVIQFDVSKARKGRTRA